MFKPLSSYQNCSDTFRLLVSYQVMTKRTTTVIVALTTAMFAWGFTPSSPSALLALSYKIEKESKLSIHGTTNVNSFDCLSNQSFTEQTVRLESDGDARRVVFRDAILQLRVDGLDCDNSSMNEDLCEALRSEEYPFIVIQLHEAQLSSNAITSRRVSS